MIFAAVVHKACQPFSASCSQQILARYKMTILELEARASIHRTSGQLLSGTQSTRSR